MKRACDNPLVGSRRYVSGYSQGMPPITIGFSTTNKLVSRAIRLITRAPCSHAWISFADATLGFRMVMQAEWWGYEIRPWARWAAENKLVAEFEPRGPALLPALRKLARDLGSKYDFISAMWAGIAAWFSRWRKARLSIRPSRTPHQLMCSEAVVRFLINAGFDFPPGVDPELVSPGDLMRHVSSSSQFRLLRKGR